METYLELSLFAFLNSAEVHGETSISSVLASNKISVAVILLSIAIPVALFYYSCKQAKMNDDALMKKRLGSLISGTD